MNKVFFSSDYHFNHARILEFQPESRPFKTIEDMNEAIIANHNEVVDDDDDVFVLGDIAFCSGYEASQFMNRMRGRKHLIIGNHDTKTLKDKNFVRAFVSVHQYLETSFNSNGKDLKYVLFHYPITEWNRCNHHSRHLHGHVHGKEVVAAFGKRYDVGLDSPHIDGSFMRPFELEEIEYILSVKPVLTHGDAS